MQATVLDFNHPIIQSVLLPLALALALTPSLLWVLGARWGKRLAAASIGLALLVALMLIFGVPAWPARSGMQKLPLIFVLLLTGGMVVDIIKLQQRRRDRAGRAFIDEQRVVVGDGRGNIAWTT